MVVGLALAACDGGVDGPSREDAAGDTEPAQGDEGPAGEDDGNDAAGDDTGAGDGPGDDEDDDGIDGDGGDPGDDDDDGPGDSGGAEETGGEPTEHPPPAPHGCVDDVSPGPHTLTCGNVSVQLMVPPQCITEPCGIVLDVHGSSMDAEQQNLNTNMRALGVEHGYLVLQPSALGLSHAPTSDEVYVGAVTDTLMAFNADPARLHVTGFSSGGNVAWRLICNYSDLFASAAPAAAADDPLIPSGCAFSPGQVPAEEIPILYMHGRLDGLEDYAGAELQRDHVIAGWAMDGPSVVETGDEYGHLRYESASGTHFDFLWHDYTTDQVAFTFALEGHCFPGSLDHSPTLPGQLAGYGCKGDNAFHFGDVAMQFFVDHPK